MTAPRTIILGITGGIAAYKTPELVRQLRQQGATVHVVLSAHAPHFVAPLALQTVSGNPVHQDLFSLTEAQTIDHIALARQATAILVAPATAHVIAKVTHGLCDDLLTTIICATTAPVFFAPAMNVQMWQNPITQANVQRLVTAGYHIIAPETGELACGEEGPGRMAALETICRAVLAHNNPVFVPQAVSIT